MVCSCAALISHLPVAAHRFLVPCTELDTLWDKADAVTLCISPARRGSIKWHLRSVPVPTPPRKYHYRYSRWGQNDFHVKVCKQRKTVIYRVNINNPWTVCNLIKCFYGIFPVHVKSGRYFCWVQICGCINCLR